MPSSSKAVASPLQMNKKRFQKYLDRDGGCVHCGDVETAVPHHRLNRGMGGSKERDVLECD